MQLFLSKSAKKKAISAGIIIVLFLIIAVILVWPLLKYVTMPTQLRALTKQFSFWAPAIFILLQVIQMVFLVIPGATILIAGGYAFGNVSIIYSLIGIMIGSFIVFQLGRLFGRPFLESIFDKKVFEKIDNKSNTIGKTLFILFLIPPLPHDTFSLLAGITNISLKKYMLISFVGRLPLIVFYSIMGNQLTKLNLFYSLLLLIIIGIGSLVIFFHKDKIEGNLHKYAKKIGRK